MIERGLIQLLLGATPLTLPAADPQLLEAVVEAVSILSAGSRECRDQIFNSGEAENLIAMLGDSNPRIQMAAVRCGFFLCFFFLEAKTARKFFSLLLLKMKP